MKKLFIPLFLCMVLFASSSFSQVANSSNSTSSESTQTSTDPKEKGKCVGWEKQFPSWPKTYEHPYESTRAQCEKENKDRQRDLGNLSGADFHPTPTESSQSSTSNCTAINFQGVTSKARR